MEKAAEKGQKEHGTIQWEKNLKNQRKTWREAGQIVQDKKWWSNFVYGSIVTI